MKHGGYRVNRFEREKWLHVISTGIHFHFWGGGVIYGCI